MESPRKGRTNVARGEGVVDRSFGLGCCRGKNHGFGSQSIFFLSFLGLSFLLSILRTGWRGYITSSYVIFFHIFIILGNKGIKMVKRSFFYSPFLFRRIRKKIRNQKDYYAKERDRRCGRIGKRTRRSAVTRQCPVSPSPPPFF